jgi:2'-5' RNA ligase superfamily
VPDPCTPGVGAAECEAFRKWSSSHQSARAPTVKPCAVSTRQSLSAYSAMTGGTAGGSSRGGGTATAGWGTSGTPPGWGGNTRNGLQVTRLEPPNSWPTAFSRSSNIQKGGIRPAATSLAASASGVATPGQQTKNWAAESVSSSQPDAGRGHMRRQSAVIVPFPGVEHFVAAHRSRLDATAAWGVPAHVTVLYPFMPPEALNEATLATLAAAVSTVPSFECTFSGPFVDDAFLWLQPDAPSRQSFLRLTSAVWEAFPDYPPYQGAHRDDLTPHLTVAEPRRATVNQARAAARDVAQHLPYTSPVGEALLIAGSEAPNSWRSLCSLPMG